MAYKVTISDGTILEKSIESVTFNADLPADTSYCIRTYTINSMQIAGRIGAGEKTIGLYKWALLPTNNPGCYKEIMVEQIHVGQIVRNVKFSKAFVVDYSESYSKGDGFGLFSIFIRQLAEIDIELTNEITPQTTMIEVSDEAEEQSLPPVQAVGIATSPIAKNNRPKFTDIIAKKKAMQDNHSEFERASRLDGDAKIVEAYWNEYYTKVGQQGDNISNLINSAQKRSYGKGNLAVKDLGYSGYNNGQIATGSNTKKWEFIEEFLHYKVDNNQAFRKVRKGIQGELKARRIGSVGRVSEEIAVKQWMLNKSKFLMLDEATQMLLKNQINQLRRYGLDYGY